MRELASLVRGAVILAGDEAYESARHTWNLAVDRRPAAIVRCADVDDVRRTIEFTRLRGLPLAIRGGGHSQAGHGTCDDGVVVDLGALRGVEVDGAERVVRASGGVRVADVQDALREHGMLTPMGGCPEVGIGGLTLGGGENFLMGRFGVVCDNVIRAELVTADGELLSLSDTEHPDLFWAIRGGGGNFGVVTRLEYRVFPSFGVLFGQLSFPVARTRETMRRYLDLVQDAPDHLNTSCGLPAAADHPVFTINFCHSGGRDDGDRTLDRFRSALRPAQDTVKWTDYAADLVVPPAPSTGTGTFLPSLDVAVLGIFAAAAPEAPVGATVTFTHFHGAVTRVAVDATAFPLRHPGFDVFITVPWGTEDERRAADQWMKPLAAALQPFGRGVYVNNLNSDEAHRVPDAYGSNYERIAAIKRKHDPSNLFRVNHNIR